MTEEQIQKLAEQEYPVTTQTMYNEVDDIYVDIDLSEPFREAFIKGYKAAMLQGMGWVKGKLESFIEESKNSAAFMKPGYQLTEKDWNKIYDNAVFLFNQWLDESKLQNKGEWISVEDKDEILNSLSELIRSISRALNKKEFIKSIDLPRLEKAKSVLAKHSNNSEKIIQSTPPEQ